MANDNIQPEGEQPVQIDPSRFPATPPLTTQQIERLTEAVDACERGEVVEGDEFLEQLAD